MNAKPVTKVVVRRNLSADPAAVFECFSSAEMLAKWFYAGDATRCEAQSEFRVGGALLFRMFGPGDEVSEHRGRWISIEPNERLRLLWIHDEQAASLVQFDFESAGAATRVTVSHTDLPADMGPLFEQGWAQCLGYLARAVTENSKP